MGTKDEKVTLTEQASQVDTSQRNETVAGGAVDGISGQASTPGEGDGIHIARADAAGENKSFRPVTETKEHGRPVTETK